MPEARTLDPAAFPAITPSQRSLNRNPDLAVAAQYRRTIHASLERIWENVYDWEHLPWLHELAFGGIALLDSGDWGWHVRVGFPGGETTSEIELVADTTAGEYVARTLSGLQAGGEIWTRLEAKSLHETDITVDFCVDPMPSEALEALGQGYVGLYTMLWSEDEAMMRHREAALAESPAEKDPKPVELGPIDALRARLPLTIDYAGRPWRIVQLNGDLVIHSTRCPHLLGPLEGDVDASGKTTCPWHGYEFDIETGRSCDGRKLRLAPPPSLHISESGDSVTLRPAF